MAILTEKKIWRRTSEPTERDKRRQLTPEQQKNVQRAIVFLAVRLGSPEALADALGMTVDATWKARGTARRKSVRLALVVSRAAGVGVDDVLSGAWPASGACPYCGRP
jgi:hypothetical protein